MPRARCLLLLLLTLLAVTAQAGLGPSGRWGHTLTLLDGELWLFGGMRRLGGWQVIFRNMNRKRVVGPKLNPAIPPPPEVSIKP